MIPKQPTQQSQPMDVDQSDECLDEEEHPGKTVQISTNDRGKAIGSIPLGGPIKLFPQPVLHNWCCKGLYMYYSLYGIVHIN